MPKPHHLLGALLLLPALSLTAPAAHAAGDAGGCRYVPVAKLPISYTDASHRAIIPGTINGKPARLIADTGAYHTVMFLSGAERLGLPLDTTGKYDGGIGGASVRYRARIDDLSVGIAHSGKDVIDVVTSAGKADGDALVGADFLLQTDMELALADNYLQFFRPSGCADTILAYWDSNAMEVPFAGREGNSNKPYVTVELNGVKLTAILDTGAPHSSVTRRAAERAGVRVDGAGVRPGPKTGGIGTERVDSWFATFDSFTIGQETVKRPALTILEAPSTGRRPVDMLLGADFLRTHRILFAMSQDRLYMSFLGGDPFPPPRSAAPRP